MSLEPLLDGGRRCRNSREFFVDMVTSVVLVPLLTFVILEPAFYNAIAGAKRQRKQREALVRRREVVK